MSRGKASCLTVRPHVLVISPFSPFYKTHRSVRQLTFRTLRKWTKETFSLYLFLLAMIGLVSCSSEPTPELSIDTVSIFTEPDTNENSAIAVDLVLIYDPELVKIIGQMSAAKYFSSSKQLLLDNPTLLDIWHWELVPGQIVQNFTPPQEQGNAYAGFVFANYLTPGDHRLRVSPNGIVKILLLRNDLKNLASSNAPEMRMGTTMTNIPRNEEMYWDAEAIELGGMGPCPMSPPITPCNSNVPKFSPTSRKGGDCSSNLCSPRGQPVSIITRPLSPPPSCGRSPTPNKVKVWHN